MNKILQLFDEQFVLELLRKEALSLYVNYKDAKAVQIVPHKKMIWSDHYHVVIEFRTQFINLQDKIEKISIFCSAHHEEPRKNVYSALQYLWGKDLPSKGVDLPRPLFFSKEFNGIFYEGIQGDSLYGYIKRKDFPVIEKMVAQTARMFAKLHQVPTSPEANFNPINSRIETTIPGVEAIYTKMAQHFGDDNPYNHSLRKMYSLFISQEEKNRAQNNKSCLIHGDAHSENIIRTGEDRVGLIDFTDICLGDFARDLGTFLQQLEYKMILKGIELKKVQAMKTLFLNTYLEFTGVQLSDDLRARIDLYYNWTAIRSAIFLFLKHDNDPSGGEALFFAIKNKLKL